MSTCIVCGSPLLYPLYNPGPQPVACLDTHLAKSIDVATKAPRFPMAYHQCQSCGHVFNTEFEIENVDYKNGSSTIYNSSRNWQDHMQNIVNVLSYMHASQTIIEIGCGDCVFLNMLKAQHATFDASGTIIGFDPGVTNDPDVVSDYFVPDRDLKKYKPGLIVCRHVLEHIHNPREFVLEIWKSCNEYKMTPTLYFEVPCFELGFQQGRVFDFIYEHVSNYSIESFKKLFGPPHFSEVYIDKVYNEEVIGGLVKVCLVDRGADTFNKQAQETKTTMDSLKDVVVWGGSGKCASFLNMYNLTSVTHVVDSDPKKWGFRVPGTGQLIMQPSTIEPHETIVIPTIWRALDIYTEIVSSQLKYKQILVPLKGKLHDYESNPLGI